LYKLNCGDAMIIREEYYKKIDPFIGKPVIKIISGMRRSGKSSFMKMLLNRFLEQGVKKKEYYLYKQRLNGIRFYQRLFGSS